MQWQMFLLVSGRHVGAHPDGHKHGVSIQISKNLGKTSLHISLVRNIAVTWILARGFVYLPSFFSQILDLIYWAVLISISIYFQWRDTENQQWPIPSLLVNGNDKKAGGRRAESVASTTPCSSRPPALFWSSPLTKSLEQAGYFLIAGLRVLLAAKCFL